jgi:2,5-furandicarboxylate decarboxylase 1
MAMPKDMRTYIRQLEEQRPDDLVTVRQEVHPKFGVTAIIQKLEEEGRFPVVFFERVKGSDLPLLINLTASYPRLALTVDSSLKEMVQECARRETNTYAPKEVSDAEAPVKEVILKGEDADLSRLPITQHNELDGGLFISGGVLLQKDPDSGKINAGIYRHQIFDQHRFGVMQNPAHHGRYIGRKYEDAGKPQPAALVIGHHPALLMAAVAKVPGIGGELDVCGGYLGEPLEVVRGETVDIPIPARAEIVIEGYIPPGERIYEGPFGEWPHYYTGKGDMPFMVVTAILMRRDAIYQDLFASHPEHNICGALPRMGSLYRRIQEVVPSVVNVNLPYSGGSRAFCYISIRKRSEGEPQQAAFAALTVETDIKHVYVVDDDIDVFNETEVLWALATRFEADDDLIIMPNCMGAHLNPTAHNRRKTGHGPLQTKCIFDCTKPAPPEEFPPRAQVPAEIVADVDLDRVLETYRGIPRPQTAPAAR